MVAKIHVDGNKEAFDLNAYLRGFYGSVVRFGAKFIHGYSVQSRHRQYAGWVVSPIHTTPNTTYGKAKSG